MKFKSNEVKEEFLKTSIFLRQMAEDMDSLSQELFRKELIITRVKEQIEGDSGVHDDNRAFDVRDEYEGVRSFTEGETALLLDFMNTKYKRNDGKPTCINHSFNGGPHHFHVQISAYTKTYEGVE